MIRYPLIASFDFLQFAKSILLQDVKIRSSSGYCVISWFIALKCFFKDCYFVLVDLTVDARTAHLSSRFAPRCTQDFSLTLLSTVGVGRGTGMSQFLTRITERKRG